MRLALFVFCYVVGIVGGVTWALQHPIFDIGRILSLLFGGAV